MSDFLIYLGLFGVAFLAATILPAQSELGLGALILSGEYSISALVVAASLGNTLGALINWLLGRGIERFRSKKWFPTSVDQMERATNWYHQYGYWSLLLSWVPIIGDPITVVAGILREPLWRFIAIVAFAKTARYLVIASLALKLL